MKKRTILINNNPFTFEDESMDITYNSIRPITIDEAKNLLQTTRRLFDEKGLKFYLSFGTLLGAVRDKNLIKGDEDVDVYVEDEKGLYESLPYFHENGLKLCRFTKGVLYSFKTINDSYIDVYIKRPFKFSIWGLWCYSINSWAMPKKYFRATTKMDFLGVECLCADPPEALLEFWYGKTWQTPVRGHKFIYSIIPAYYWNKVKEDFKCIVKICIGWNLWKDKVKN